MKKIVTIGGSNSKQSINKQLAEYVGKQLQNTEKINIDLNEFEAPIYAIDIENDLGIPKPILKLNEFIESADGFVVSLAEHNGSYTVAFKNVFDWLSRVNKDVWRNKPMLLLSTSPGARGGATVLATAKATFPHLGGDVVDAIAVPSFYDNFKEGKLVDDVLLNTLQKGILALTQKL